MMIKNNFLNLIFLIMLASSSFVVSQEDVPIYVDISLGECASVDLNDDEIPDVIICYNEDESITIDDVIAVGEDIESVADGNTTIIIPSITTSIKKYELPFDEEELKNEIIGQYSKYIYSLGFVILVCLVLIVILFNKIDKKTKERKITKSVTKKRKKRK